MEMQLPRSDAVQRVLGFDVGTRRIGVAFGQRITNTAQIVDVVKCGEHGADWSKVDAILKAWSPEGLVVGLPLSLDGHDQSMTQFARQFAELLKSRYALPVYLFDERYTSQEANRRFADYRKQGQLRKQDAAKLDALAACVIVENFLNEGRFALAMGATNDQPAT